MGARPETEGDKIMQARIYQPSKSAMTSGMGNDENVALQRIRSGNRRQSEGEEPSVPFQEPAAITDHRPTPRDV